MAEATLWDVVIDDIARSSSLDPVRRQNLRRLLAGDRVGLVRRSYWDGTISASVCDQGGWGWASTVTIRVEPLAEARWWQILRAMPAASRKALTQWSEPDDATVSALLRAADAVLPPGSLFTRPMSVACAVGAQCRGWCEHGAAVLASFIEGNRQPGKLLPVFGMTEEHFRQCASGTPAKPANLAAADFFTPLRKVTAPQLAPMRAPVLDVLGEAPAALGGPKFTKQLRTIYGLLQGAPA